MPVNIKLVGPKDKPEYQDGLFLKDIFQNNLGKNVHGQISIACGVQLFGCNPRDVDIVVFGKLDNARFNLKTDTHQEKGTYKPREVFLDNFFFCIESKLHGPEDIEMLGTNLVVNYGKKKHDATSQSEGQKYSLLNYIKNIHNDASLWICNFIWLRNLTIAHLNNLVGEHPHNILPSSFDLKYLLNKACLQYTPRKLSQKHYYSFSPINKIKTTLQGSDYQQLHELFSAPRQASGSLTRRNVERITANKIKIESSLNQALGKKLVIVAGRAGTGKTVKMLQIGCELASSKEKRCLFLTYNRALVNDIQRTLYFADISIDFDQGCISVMTIHEFVRKLGTALGLIEAKEYKIENHINLCTELTGFLEEEIITSEDILTLMQERQELACWDQVFVDEAQDFHEKEKVFLFNFFGYQKLVVADGVDQFVRGSTRLDWGKNIYVTKSVEKRSLRQKSNLASFVNSYANEIDLDWQVKTVSELVGGKVIISNKLIPFQLLSEVRDRCYEQGNKAFELLFLTPPNLVSKFADGSREFKMLNDFEDHGFSLWDGTREDLRSSAPLKIDQHRLLQYDSCRGLEGWSVVCLGFDDFIEYKKRSFSVPEENTPGQALVAMDSDEMCRRFVGLWSLIPLTRAIDSLVITLSNPNGEVAQQLKACSNEDYVKFV